MNNSLNMMIFVHCVSFSLLKIQYTTMAEMGIVLYLDRGRWRDSMDISVATHIQTGR